MRRLLTCAGLLAVLAAAVLVSGCAWYIDDRGMTRPLYWSMEIGDWTTETPGEQLYWWFAMRMAEARSRTQAPTTQPAEGDGP